MTTVTNDSLNETLLRASEAFASGQYGVAYSLYERLANGGHADSQVFVGWMLAEGKGVPLDANRAMEWFERAALMGSAHGAFYLARRLTVTGKHERAFEWYRRSAASNYLPAIFWVGYSLARGKGTRADVKEAQKYLTEAKERGHVYAQRELALLDMRGERGHWRRVTGAVAFFIAVLRGFAISTVDDTSENLRA